MVSSFDYRCRTSTRGHIKPRKVTWTLVKPYAPVYNTVSDPYRDPRPALTVGAVGERESSGYAVWAAPCTAGRGLPPVREALTGLTPLLDPPAALGILLLRGRTARRHVLVVLVALGGGLQGAGCRVQARAGALLKLCELRAPCNHLPRSTELLELGDLVHERRVAGQTQRRWRCADLPAARSRLK